MAYFNIFQTKWPETATLEPLEVPVEPRSAAVEHVAAPVEHVLSPLDKGSSPWRLQRPCLSPSGSPFLLAALPHINYACGYDIPKCEQLKGGTVLLN